MTADRLWAAPLEKQLGDHGAELTADLDPSPVLTCPPRGRSPVSVERVRFVK